MVKAKDKFKDCTDLQNYLKKGGILFDIIYLDNVPLLMDYYDSEGKEVTFGNPEKNVAIELLTGNRYKNLNSYQDVEINLIDDPIFRNDINYEVLGK